MSREGSPSSETPCATDEGAVLELGSPRRGADHAEFATAGGTVHVAVRHFEKGGIFDPEVGRAAVYVGDAAAPPSYDERSGRVSEVVGQTSVQEGKWAELELEAGRYWLWVTNGSDVVVVGCEPDAVTDPLPAGPAG
ncbi:hypothetical protein Q9R32_00720 [Actinotalea sp. AC32]|nr:hypothetical protein [Actinotalea sp. AC32]